MIRSRLLLVAALFVMSAGATSAQERMHFPTPAEPTADIYFQGEDGRMIQGVRCAAHDPIPDSMKPTHEQVERFLLDEYGTTTFSNSTVTIPIAFHVIYDGRTNEGNVPLSMINAQIQVLNDAFASRGFQFTLQQVTRTNNRQWFTLRHGSTQETQMKNSLAVDPARTLNFYSAKPGGGVLGWATFPWMYPQTDKRHGVVILFSSMPGGSSAPYNLGDTGTHEVGHFLGLYHTFQDGCNGSTSSTCSTAGDRVCDTPQISSATYGCPTSKASCTAGVQALFRNFMDYTDDHCMDSFTQGQRDRMHQQTAFHRSTMYGGSRTPAPVSTMAIE